MSVKSSTGKQVKNGKAFEYSIASQYHAFLKNIGNNVEIVENKPLIHARNCYEAMTLAEKERFDNAAYNTIGTMIKLEPGLVEQKDDNDTLHSTDGPVEKSLKFDIKLLGNPPILFTQYIFQ